VLLTPRELMLSPTAKGGEVHFIPYGHLSGLQIAKFQMIKILRSQYIALGEASDPKLVEQFRKNQQLHNQL